MNKQDLSVRIMRSSDLDQVIRIHIFQFPNSRSSQLGKPFLRRMYNWFIRYQTKLALVAEYNHTVIGYVVGSIGGYGRNIFRYALPQIVIGVISHPKMILRKETFSLWHSYIKGLLPRRSRKSTSQSLPDEINAALSSIAVDINYQGKGVGKELMQKFEAHAKELNANTASLTVEQDNPAAINLYESCGWTIDTQNEQSVHFVKSLD